MSIGETPAPVTLQDVLHGIPIAAFAGDKKTVVSALRTDSRRVGRGDLFLAMPGTRTSGERFIVEAVSRGAAAVLSGGEIPPRPQVAWARAEDMPSAAAAAARNFFQHPERDLRAVGVTGTNGKTTVSTLLRHLLGWGAGGGAGGTGVTGGIDDAAGGEKWGLIGTVRYELGGRELPAHRTTPDAVEFTDLLAQMRDAGCAGFVAEISSHAIAQRRVDGLAFEALAFTNLSRDHIDYHGDMEAYFGVKASAFLGTAAPPPAHAVINADDAHGRRLLALLPPAVRAHSFGLAEDADVRAENIVLEAGRSRFRVLWPEGAGEVSTTLPGHYNVSNVLCALALARALGRDIGALLPRVSGFGGVAGRMERVAPDLPFQIFVDYAHTDDALRNALEMLRAITKGRLLLVFGCGGDRDRGKRPKMMAAAQEFADFAWATADNPRKEPQEQIFDDMRAGITAPEKVMFIEDRRHAIAAALDAADTGDTLLIAGKGHEATQEFADVTVPFDDRLVTRELLALRRQRTHVQSA
ncbi:MAG: UDP-N-acetylmuramoyl-L-alanyl-D-glutamate--2,6-diaminopimelate ligase [Puniceicoccales bacterium]|jgi:UDP-N-acetylmuramoyl-L-alanyl-D-glutamate--2,6-diaminopimelate ligase|nr:UDP-N-acetylmuramoyl-L-alanyl-D-glutamate--2,6-diaminopimelate ligase [Puniceicoccales bacterium]